MFKKFMVIASIFLFFNLFTISTYSDVNKQNTTKELKRKQTFVKRKKIIRKPIKRKVAKRKLADNNSGFGKPRFENVTIFRLQIRVKTMFLDGAKTDDPVSIRLNNKDKEYFLNKPGNDREKGATNTYEIVSPNINKIKDIQFISLKIHGKDGWNIQNVELLVNNKRIYVRKFPNGYWLDKGNKKRKDTFYVPVREMRKHENYRYTNSTKNFWKSPEMIPKWVIDRTVASVVGNLLHNVKKLTWSKKPWRETFRKKQRRYSPINSKRIAHYGLEYKLDLSYEVNNAPNVKINASFQLVFSCKKGIIRATIIVFDSKASGVTKYLKDDAVKKVLSKIKSVLNPRCEDFASDRNSERACYYEGIGSIGHLFNFNFDYENPTPATRNCTGKLGLDSGGNLRFGVKKIAPNKPARRRSKNKVKRRIN